MYKYRLDHITRRSQTGFGYCQIRPAKPVLNTISVNNQKHFKRVIKKYIALPEKKSGW